VIHAQPSPPQVFPSPQPDPPLALFVPPSAAQARENALSLFLSFRRIRSQNY
jgi:hypothetical protein